MLVAAAEEAVAGAPIADPGAAAADLAALAGMAPEACIQIQTKPKYPAPALLHLPQSYFCVLMEMIILQTLKEMHRDSEVPDKGLHSSPLMHCENPCI